MGEMMKRLLFGLLVSAAVFLAAPLQAGAAEYKTFVGCDDLAVNPVPSHVCQTSDFPGAYFESDVDAEYEVCLEAPGGDFDCLEEQSAEAGVLYVNSFFADIPGDYFISWYIGDTEVGFWDLRINAPAPPPTPPVVTVPSLPAPPVLAVAPSAKCLKAQQRVAKLKARLKKASGREQRAKIRAQLKKARTAAKNAC